MTDASIVPVRKDLTAQQPIPTVWRETLRRTADAIAAAQFDPGSLPQAVVPLTPADVERFQEATRAYGATLIALPAETWKTSVCIWTGAHWDALIDLWTLEEGSSDLVMAVRITESGPAFSFCVKLVYVP